MCLIVLYVQGGVNLYLARYQNQKSNGNLLNSASQHPFGAGFVLHLPSFDRCDQSSPPLVGSSFIAVGTKHE